MSIILANNVASTLAQDLTTGAGSLRVASGTGSRFPVLVPGSYYYLTLVATDGRLEIVKATARSGDQITITRAQESTQAAAFTAGAKVELRTTAQSIRDALASASIYVGTSPPEGPSINTLWVDTN